jgi:hypothetical protein
MTIWRPGLSSETQSSCIMTCLCNAWQQLAERALQVCLLCFIPEGTNSPRLFTSGETKALAESKVHQLSQAWVTNGVGWVVILTDLKNMADCHE